MNKFTSLMAIIEAEDEACRQVYRCDREIEKLVASERAISENPFECDAKERDLENVRRDIEHAFAQRRLAERQVYECREHLREYREILFGDATCPA